MLFFLVAEFGRSQTVRQTASYKPARGSQECRGNSFANQTLSSRGNPQRAADTVSGHNKWTILTSSVLKQISKSCSETNFADVGVIIVYFRRLMLSKFAERLSPRANYWLNWHAGIKIILTNFAQVQNRISLLLWHKASLTATSTRITHSHTEFMLSHSEGITLTDQFWNTI
jgi:hypothetical protein